MLKLFRKWLYPKSKDRTLDVLEDAVKHIQKETTSALIIIIAVDEINNNIDVCTNEGVNMIGALDYLHQTLVCGNNDAQEEYTKYECKQHLDLWLERLEAIEKQQH